MTNEELGADVAPVAIALRELAEQMFEGMNRLRDPIPGSELADLASLHHGAVITVADSIASAMDAVACGAHTLAFLIENQSAPAYEPIHASLIRQMLIGAFTTSYVLGPADIGTREERARNLVAAEYGSALRAAKSVQRSAGLDFAALRGDADGWVDDLLADRKEFTIATSSDDKTGSIAVKGSEEFVELLVGALRDREDITGQDRERLLANVPDTTEWAWQITSGFAHAYHWPYKITRDEDVPRLLTQLIEAIRMASTLCGFAAITSRDRFHSFHRLMRGDSGVSAADVEMKYDQRF